MVARHADSLCVFLSFGLFAVGGPSYGVSAFVVPPARATRFSQIRGELFVSSTTDELSTKEFSGRTSQKYDMLAAAPLAERSTEELSIGAMPDLVAKLQEKMGSIGDDRIIYPELETGEVPRLYSTLKYEKGKDGKVESSHAEGSVIAAAALIAGTTIGAGVLALPTATAAAGFLPSSAALGLAWFYMTMSGLLIAELTLNRIGTSGRPGLGLLELYENSLGEQGGRIGSIAYFGLHYAVMVAYIAQGGTNIDGFLSTTLGLGPLAPGVGQALFAGTCGMVLYASSSAAVEKINNFLVFGVVASFLGIVGVGSLSADFEGLVNPQLQHPEEVVNCLPILFLSLVFQNVVPSVVAQLEGNRSKITNAIVGGTTVPFLMFVAFNGVVLGNALNAGVDLTSDVNPITLLQSSPNGGLVASLVGGFSMLAVITSLIGFTYGLLDAWTDVLKLPSEGKEFERWKSGLYGLVFVPPLALAVANPDIFYSALDYAGAFGVSTLFLVLPPYMVWQERYGDQKFPLATKPMGKSYPFAEKTSLRKTLCSATNRFIFSLYYATVPFGKIPLGSMYKAAGTLILEQGAEKLGVFEFISNHISLASFGA